MTDLPPIDGDDANETTSDTPFLLDEELMDGLPVLHLTGEVDLAAAPAVRDRLTALVQQLGVSGPNAPTAVVLDLGRVSFIDSTGLSMLVAAHSRFNECGKELRVADVPPRVRRVLELTGLDGLLSTYDDVPSALRGSTEDS